MIIDNKLVISKKAKPVLMQELKSHGFKPIPKNSDPAKKGEDAELADDENGDDNDDAELGSDVYDYLLGVGFFHLINHTLSSANCSIDATLVVDEGAC